MEDEEATMLSRIERYYIVEFDSFQEYEEFRDVLMSFVSSLKGLRYVTDDPRCCVGSCSARAVGGPPTSLTGCDDKRVGFRWNGEFVGSDSGCHSGSVWW